MTVSRSISICPGQGRARYAESGHSHSAGNIFPPITYDGVDFYMTRSRSISLCPDRGRARYAEIAVTRIVQATCSRLLLHLTGSRSICVW